MRFREVPPPEDLCRLVACFWEFEAGPGLPPGHIHTIPTDGCTSVSCLVGHGPVAMIGPRLESHRMPIYPDTRYIGVRFMPGATRAVFGVEGARLRDFVGLMDSMAPNYGAGLRVVLQPGVGLDEAAPGIAQIVRLWSARHGEPDREVLAGAGAIMHSGGTARIARVASGVGLSERQFERRFGTEVGLTPKQFARIVRFRAAAVDVAMRGAGNWGEVAAHRGFADQAHLVREFAEIFGMTPSEFQRVFAPAIEHIDVR